MTKSLLNYNYLAAKKLEDIKAFREYGFSNQGELPKYKRSEIKKNKPGWKVFFLALRP